MTLERRISGISSINELGRTRLHEKTRVLYLPACPIASERSQKSPLTGSQRHPWWGPVFTREPPLGSKRDVQDTVRAALLAGKHVGTLCADRLLLCFEKLPAVTAAVVEDSRAHPATRSGRSRGGVRETVDQDRNRAPHRKAKEPEKRSGRAVRDSRETVGRPTLDD